MSVALFDLDNTLLSADSDYLWGEFLVREGVLPQSHGETNDAYYQAYLEGKLDAQEFFSFQLEPLSRHSAQALHRWRETFIETLITPHILPAGLELMDRHRDEGLKVAIATATNAFITRPIAARLGVEALIATEPEIREGQYTGQYTGVPCFGPGKLTKVREWLEQEGLDLSGSWFYSDSHNDLPLLEAVEHPVAVDPDPILDDVAKERGWPILSFR